MRVGGPAGLIAPLMNVPAQLIADGVNMPWTNIAKPLLALSLPLAAAALAWFAWCGRKMPLGAPASRPPLPSMRQERAGRPRSQGGVDSLLAGLRGFVPLALIHAIWIAGRICYDDVARASR